MDTRRVMRDALAAFAIGMLSVHVAAADQRRTDPGQEALRRAQYLLRDLNAKLEAAQAENGKLQGRLAASEKKVAALERAGTRSAKRNRELKRYNSGLAGRLRQYQQRLEELAQAQRKTLAQLEETRTQRDGLRSILARQVRRIEYCEGANRKLYRAGIDLLRSYRDKGVWDALLQREPVTGIGRVQLENILQGYRERIEKAHLGTGTTAAR